MEYIISLCLLLLFYILVIHYMERIKTTRLFNALASIVIYSAYLYVVYRTYQLGGFDDWNFQNTLPTANVSPFMFSLMPLTWILPFKVKRHLFLLIALLAPGMLLSSVFGCIFNAMRDYRFHLHFLADYIAHFVLSLWGIYLVKSRQVRLCWRDCFISGSIIICSALLMVGLNVIFDTAFFGLSLNGKHNIYNMVVVDNSLISAIIYFVGLIIVMILGYLFNKLLTRKSNALA